MPSEIRPMESTTWAHFRQIFELFIELYRICTHFSYIEYVLRIHFVKISLIFIKYEPSTVRPKGLAHERFFDPYVVKNHDFSWIWKTLAGPEPHSKTHTYTHDKTLVLRELRFHMNHRVVVSRLIRMQRRYTVRIRWNSWLGHTLDRFSNYLLSCTGSVHIFPT